MGWKDAVNDLVDQFTNNQLGNASLSLNNFFQRASPSGAVYSVSPKDWYKTYPYRFVVEISNSTSAAVQKCYYSLPIPPESLNYQMIIASQLTPTLGGVVEETSENVFWQIGLSGTTGISIGRQYGPPGQTDKSGKSKNTKDKLDMPAMSEENFRTILKGGIFANTANKIANLAADVVDIVDDPVAGAFGALEALATTSQRFRRSGVVTSVTDDSNPFLKAAAKAANIDPKLLGEVDATNGYVEIHLLHNFLITYSKLKEKYPKDYNLFFESHKDNMRWQVAVKNFMFQKNANQPYLYKYNIALQGFNLEASGTSATRKALVADRFGPKGDLGGINSITITGAITKAYQIARKLRKIQKNGESLISKPPVI